MTRSNLASVYLDSGQPDKATPLLEETLTASERILGTDHPNTLMTRSNLASAFQDNGQLDKALPLFEETLTASERILGTDHPNTLIYRRNLADAVNAANRANETAKR